MLYALVGALLSAVTCIGLVAGLFRVQERRPYGSALAAMSSYLFLLPIAALWVLLTKPGGDAAEPALGLLSLFYAGIALLAARFGAGQRIVGAASLWVALCIATVLTVVWAVRWSPPCSSPARADAGMGFVFLLVFIGAVLGLVYVGIMITGFVYARSTRGMWKSPFLGIVGTATMTIILIVHAPRFLASPSGLADIAIALAIGVAVFVSARQWTPKGRA